MDSSLAWELPLAAGGAKKKKKVYKEIMKKQMWQILIIGESSKRYMIYFCKYLIKQLLKIKETYQLNATNMWSLFDYRVEQL